jgi:ABC-type lipoprotein export system ATPase subunit
VNQAATQERRRCPTRRNVIALRNVEKSIESKAGRTWLLRRIDLDIRKGEFVTIMGPSGAGKSTLLGILGMLDDGWEGQFWLGGEAVHTLPRKRRQELAKQSIGSSSSSTTCSTT